MSEFSIANFEQQISLIVDKKMMKVNFENKEKVNKELAAVKKACGNFSKKNQETCKKIFSEGVFDSASLAFNENDSVPSNK